MPICLSHASCQSSQLGGPPSWRQRPHQLDAVVHPRQATASRLQRIAGVLSWAQPPRFLQLRLGIHDSMKTNQGFGFVNCSMSDFIHSRNRPFTTWGQFRQARPQFQPSSDQLAPTSASLGSKMVQLGRNTWPQLGPKLGSIWLRNNGHGLPNPKSSRLLFSLVCQFFWLSMTLRLKQCSPCCASVGPTLV